MFVCYFQDLHKADHAASTIGTSYSKMNASMKMKHDIRLQSWPKLTVLLKKYEENTTVKQGAVFTTAEMQQFVEEETDDAHHVVRQAFVAVAFSGGLRTKKALELTHADVSRMENTDDDSTVYKINFASQGQGSAAGMFLLRDRLPVESGESVLCRHQRFVGDQRMIRCRVNATSRSPDCAKLYVSAVTKKA